MSTALLVAVVTLGGMPGTEELRFLKSVVKLGEIRGQVKQSQRFFFANAGDQPIHIVDVQRSCGCLAPTIDKKTYLPGQHGVLEVEVRAAGQPDGPHTWFAAVRYLVSGKLKSARIRVEAVVKNEVTLTPPVLGYIGPGPFRQELLLTDRRPNPLEISDARTSSDLIQARVIPGESGQHRILLTSAAQLPVGRHDAKVTVYTSDPDYRTLEVPVTLTIREPNTVSPVPDIVDLVASPGKPASETIRLRSRAGVKIEVARIITGSPALTCTWQPGPGNDATLQLSADPASISPLGLSTEIRVLLKQPAESIVVPVQVNAN